MSLSATSSAQAPPSCEVCKVQGKGYTLTEQSFKRCLADEARAGRLDQCLAALDNAAVASGAAQGRATLALEQQRETAAALEVERQRRGAAEAQAALLARDLAREKERTSPIAWVGLGFASGVILMFVASLAVD